MDDIPNLDRAYALLQDSPLFDAAYYRRQNADIPSDIDPITHFCQSGWREGRYPNPYFDPAFYQRTNPDIARAEINPLVHYLEFGDREGRRPSARFDPAWYRDQYGLGADSIALADFLERRHSGKVSPVPLFDPTWYLDRNPDVAASRSDPFEHFCAFGVIEGRDPSPDFDVKFYRTRYASRSYSSCGVKIAVLGFGRVHPLRFIVAFWVRDVIGVEGWGNWACSGALAPWVTGRSAGGSARGLRTVQPRDVLRRARCAHGWRFR